MADPAGPSCRLHDWKARPMATLVKDKEYVTGLKNCPGELDDMRNSLFFFYPFQYP